MAPRILYAKTLKCSFYRHPCFLLTGKIYNLLFFFLSFSMPRFPTLEINLLDEAVSNHISELQKSCAHPSTFFFAERWEDFKQHAHGELSFKKRKRITKKILLSLICVQGICLWLWRLSAPTSLLKGGQQEQDAQGFVQLGLNTSMGGDFTASLGNLCQSLVTLTVWRFPLCLRGISCRILVPDASSPVTAPPRAGWFCLSDSYPPRPDINITALNGPSSWSCHAELSVQMRSLSQDLLGGYFNCLSDVGSAVPAFLLPC